MKTYGRQDVYHVYIHRFLTLALEREWFLFLYFSQVSCPLFQTAMAKHFTNSFVTVQEHLSLPYIFAVTIKTEKDLQQYVNNTFCWPAELEGLCKYMYYFRQVSVSHSLRTPGMQNENGTQWCPTVQIKNISSIIICKNYIGSKKNL
jgi:hypothetical protein